MATSRTTPDPVAAIREKLRRVADETGMTQEEIGLRMGLSKGGARQSVSRLLNPEIDYDPRLSTLIAFAKAVKRPFRDLV